MILVVQRVSRAEVRVGDRGVAGIKSGLCVLCCALEGDKEENVRWLADKTVDLRIFPDTSGRSELSLLDRETEHAGEVGVLVVPQFTLAAEWRKGRRPGFDRAAKPGKARELLAQYCAQLHHRGVVVEIGAFGEDMVVDIQNVGPFTLILDSDVRQPS